MVCLEGEEEVEVQGKQCATRCDAHVHVLHNMSSTDSCAVFCTTVQYSNLMLL